MNVRRHLIALLGAAALVAVAGDSPAQAADPPTCSAALFVPTDGDTYVVEQPDSAPGAVFCSTAPDLRFGVDDAPDHGLLSALTPNGTGGATFSYVPNAGYTGADAFTLKVEDATNAPVLVPVKVSVRAAGNDRPECTTTVFRPSSAGRYLVEAGETLTGQLECFDDEGSQLAYAVATQPARGTVSELTADGEFTYTPGGEPGEDTFSLTASDGELTSVAVDVPVTVAPASNDAPTCSVDVSTTAGESGAFEVEQGQSVDALILCDDDEGDDLDFSVTRSPAHGALAPLVAAGESAVHTAFTASASYLGFDQFRVSVDDHVNDPTLVIVRLRIVPARDDAPRCTVSVAAPPVSDRHRVEQGDTVEGRLDCADEDGSLAYSVEPAPQHGQVSSIAADGTFRYTAGATATGPDTFSLVADDGANKTVVPVLMEITAAADDAPTCDVALSAGTDNDGEYLVTAGRVTHARVVCVDDEKADITFALAAPPAHGTVSALTKDGAATASFTYTPAAGYLGADTFTLTANDGTTGPQSLRVALKTVAATDGAPRCTARLHTPSTASGYEVEAGETVQGTLTCFDPDGDALTYAIALPPAAGTATAPEPSGSSARFTYTAGSATGPDQFSLVASDGTESSNVVALPITIVAAYDSPPSCSIGLFASPLPSDAYPAENARPNEGVVSCVDDEGGPLTFDVTARPQHGDLAGLTAAGTSASFRYVAATGYIGPDAATVRVRDGAGGQDVVDLLLDVRASANTAPTCTATLSAPSSGGTYTVAAGASAAGELTCQDAEADALTLNVAQAPSIGSLSALTGSGGARTFTFTAPSGPGGNDTFVVRAIDALGATGNATVAVRITPTPANPGPVDPGPVDPGPVDPGPADPGPGTPSGPSTPGAGAGVQPTSVGSSGGQPASVVAGGGGGGGTTTLALTELRDLKLAAIKKGGGVKLTFTTAAGQNVDVVLTAKVGGKPKPVGKATKSYTAAGKQTLNIKLNGVGKKALKKQRKLQLTVTITTTAPGRQKLVVGKKLSLKR